MWWQWVLVVIAICIFLFACVQIWIGVNEYLTGEWYEWRCRKKR